MSSLVQVLPEDIRKRVQSLTLKKLAVIYVLYRVIKYILSRRKLASLRTRPVLITGCDTGFGLLTTQRFSLRGIPVFAACLTEEGVKRLAHTPFVTPFLMDVTKEESVAAAYELVANKAPNGLWAIINNAGVLRSGAFEFTPISHWRIQLDVNVMGIAITTKTFFPLLFKTKGRIINIASVAGRTATPGTSAYNASKFAVEGLSDALRRELKIWGIKVILVEPGVMNTNLWDSTKLETQVDFMWKSITKEQQERYGREFFVQTEKSASLLINKLAGNPKQVVDVLEHAVTAVSPKIRYPVGLDSYIWVGLSYLPTSVADFLITKLIMRSPPIAALQKR